MPRLRDLSPADRAEAERILALPTGTEPEAAASVRRWHAFLDRHDIEHVAMLTDDFGTLWSRDQQGNHSRLWGE